MADDNSGRDSFPPPTIPTKVQCIHCGQTYESYLIQFVPSTKDHQPGAWHCPTPDCMGMGFLFDIWPTDPNWVDEQGNKMCRGEEDADFGFDEDDSSNDCA